MDIVSIGASRVASAVWQPRPGTWALTVVCKLTFRLAPGESPLADLQDDPVLDDAHWDDDPARSLAVAGDLVPFKPRADVLLVGHAFAPGGRPVRSMSARLVVGAIDKRIEVWCDRIFWQDGSLLEGPPFARMPLRYERAAGGPGTENPVGLRWDAPPDARGSVPVPNLQPARTRIVRRGDTFAPIAFAPVAPAWPAAPKLGRHAATFAPERWREQPFPGDFDGAYFNAAPPDQQVPALAPDEFILLEGLHPDHPRLETSLPGERPVARFTAGGRAGEEIALTADTLSIDTDRGVATLVWRGFASLRTPDEAGEITIDEEGTDAIPTMTSNTNPATVVLGHGAGAGGRALPFLPKPAPEPAREEQTARTLLGSKLRGATLPFGPATSPWAIPAPAPSAERIVLRDPATQPTTGTLLVVGQKARSVLPFPGAIEPRPAPRIEPVAPEPVAPEPIEDEETPRPSPPPPEEITLERCAALTASLARRRAESARILEASGVDPAEWTQAEQRWTEAIRAETAKGKTGLLRAFDAAYVARLEEERGPITLDEYARLVVAAERGSLAAVLAEMTLPRGAMMRIERVWLGKVASDPSLGTSVREALQGARAE